jgi:hypothetical protein
LITYYVLFVLDLKTRRVHIAGMTPHPDSAFMAQTARNLIDRMDGFLAGHRFLICDRDTKFTQQFKRILGCEGMGGARTCERKRSLESHGALGPRKPSAALLASSCDDRSIKLAIPAPVGETCARVLTGPARRLPECARNPDEEGAQRFREGQECVSLDAPPPPDSAH